MKVYVLQARFGQYEIDSIELLGVYTDSAVAEENKLKYSAHMEHAKYLSSPFNDEVDLENLTQSEWDLWSEWVSLNTMGLDFSNCWVDEIELNSNIKLE
jgi:L-rhamnose isomerase